MFGLEISQVVPNGGVHRLLVEPRNQGVPTDNGRWFSCVPTRLRTAPGTEILGSSDAFSFLLSLPVSGPSSWTQFLASQLLLQLLEHSSSPAPFALHNWIWVRFRNFSNTCIVEMLETSQSTELLHAVCLQSWITFAILQFSGQGTRLVTTSLCHSPF